ncbi:MAG: putative porin [Bacteroidota bacterium]
MTNKNRFYLLILFILLIEGNLFAQKQDTVAYARNRSLYFYDTPNSFNFPEFQRIDTILTGFQQYNPEFHNDHFTLWTGNTGGPSKNMVFEPDHSTGFNYGCNAFDDFMYNNYKNKYYQLRTPFSEIYYVSGPQKEDIFRVIHSQNITKTWNVALDIRFVDSWGTYYNQATDDRNILINTNYFTPNKRYRLLAAYYHNSLTVQENGGMSKDSIFENNLISQRLAVPVNLSYAQNQITETGIFIKQFLNLKRDKQDSTVVKKGFFNPGEFSYAFNYSTQAFTFTDNNLLDSNFFPNRIPDSVGVHDTTHIKRIENNFAWSSSIVNNKDASNPFRITFGVRQLYVEIKDSSITTKSFNQLIPYGSLSVIAFKKFHLDLLAEYVLGTHYESDFNLKGEMKYDFIKNSPGKRVFSVALNYNRKSADWFYEEYSSYNYKWTNNLNKEDLITANALFKTSGFKIGVTYHLLGNYIYMNNDAMPAQSSEVLHVLKAQITKHIIWKIIEIENNLIYQKASNGTIIKLPELTAMQSWYFNLKLFKKHMYLQPGVDLYYNTAYNADAYMPATRMFYTQNQIKTGNYLYCDLFINLQIKRANVFLKYQHLNKGFTNYNYYVMPHYPAQDGALKIGIQWRFWD